ncbi:MAG: hypothetical protein IPL09_05805 [Bacteroidetes bacterium]|nr:hypothetical protein [Bacteroidota bacterium]
MNGDSPCDASIANNSEKMECDKDYFNISYKDHISNWLQFCKKEAVDQPMLREIIKQYIFLINKLTNQMSDQKISTEIINEIISSRENILAANQIIDSEIEIKSSILNEALFRIKELLRLKIGII